MAKDNYLQTAGKFECKVYEPSSGWFFESAKGTPGVKLLLAVLDEDERGKEIYWQGWLSDSAINSTVTALAKTFRFNGDFPALRDGALSFAGMKCQIVTEIENYEGKDRCRVKWLNPSGGGGGGKKMEPAKVNSMLDKVTARAKEIAKSAEMESAQDEANAKPVTKPSAPPDDSPPREHDDVPF